MCILYIIYVHILCIIYILYIYIMEYICIFYTLYMYLYMCTYVIHYIYTLYIEIYVYIILYICTCDICVYIIKYMYILYIKYYIFFPSLSIPGDWIASPLCYIVGPCFLSFLNVIVCRIYICMCDWVTLLYSKKLTEHCKPALVEKN